MHFVQIKRPLLTKERIAWRRPRRGASVATEDTYHSMALVARRLGAGRRRRAGRGAGRRRDRGRDLPRLVWLSAPRSPALGRRRAVCATRSSCWAIALGWAGDLLIDHDVMNRTPSTPTPRGACSRASAARSWRFSPRPKRPRPARSAAGATPCSTTVTSTPRATPALVGGVRRGRVPCSMSRAA